MKLDESKKLYAKYRWEFLRRNPDYINQYNELQEILEDKYWCKLSDFPTKEETEFYQKWGISSTLNPRDSYEALTKSEESKTVPLAEGLSVDLEKLFFHDIFLPPEFFGKPPIKLLNFCNIDLEKSERGSGILRAYITNKLTKTGKLQIEIDLNYSKKRLIEELKGLIDQWKEIHEKRFKRELFDEWCKEHGKKSSLFVGSTPEAFDFLGIDEENIFRDMTSEDEFKDFRDFYKEKVRKRQNQYKSKYHFDNFDLYLQVWDLREQDKLSWNQIADQLFPRDPNKVQTARNHYRAACDLIEKGIELYVK